MRRRLLTLLLAALAVVIAVPLGAAWSSDRRVTLGPPRLMQTVALPTEQLPVAGSEAITLFLTGTVLIGLGIVVRRSG
jgi:hypothetical protein